MKLSWHPTHKLWCKVIGKRLAKDGKRLVQAQFYFSADRDGSEVAAAAIKEQWLRLKRTWKQSHQTYLETYGEPFADVPHWYKDAAPSSPSITPEDRLSMDAERDEVTADEMAYASADLTLEDVREKYLAHRRQREGVDFKAESNKSFETDLSGAFGFLKPSTTAATFPATGVDAMRISMKKSKRIEDRTILNYGNAFKKMLRWYWKSEHFRGGTPFGDFDEQWAKFPKLRNAKPKHLSLDTLAVIMGEATAVRKLYLLLMLNTGMQPTDIASVQTEAFDLDTGLVTWKRRKNERIDGPSDVEIVSRLWPETISMLKNSIAKSGNALRNQFGKSLANVSAKRYRNNAVAKSLAKFFGRLAEKGIDASGKNFRQTGAQLIEDASDYHLARIWLGRAFERVDRSYLKQTYEKLDDAAEMVRQKLLAAGVLSK